MIIKSFPTITFFENWNNFGDFQAVWVDAFTKAMTKQKQAYNFPTCKNSILFREQDDVKINVLWKILFFLFSQKILTIESWLKAVYEKYSTDTFKKT